MQQFFSKKTLVFPGGNRRLCPIPPVDQIKVLSFCRFCHQRRSRRKRRLADGGSVTFQKDLIHGPLTQAPHPSMQGAVMRCNARYCQDGLTKAVFRRSVVNTSGFNDRQTKGFVGKDLNRKYANATSASFAKCKGDRAFLVDGHTARVKQDTVSLHQPGLQAKTVL